MTASFSVDAGKEDSLRKKRRGPVLVPLALGVLSSADGTFFTKLVESSNEPHAIITAYVSSSNEAVFPTMLPVPLVLGLQDMVDRRGCWL